MGKLRVLSGLDVCAILQRHGFREVRRRGSHIVMQRVTDDQLPDSGDSNTAGVGLVPLHGGMDLVSSLPDPTSQAYGNERYQEPLACCDKSPICDVMGGCGPMLPRRARVSLAS
ncbi:MAG: type II toxin-antitoxin system HicA family toxin [Planctomycetia bacterium]|nr:type II toxin-antitoxin system HicA family toxin [Planctomycetia bacterium]